MANVNVIDEEFLARAIQEHEADGDDEMDEYEEGARPNFAPLKAHEYVRNIYMLYIVFCNFKLTSIAMHYGTV
jgi:hypothetical protein